MATQSPPNMSPAAVAAASSPVINLPQITVATTLPPTDPNGAVKDPIFGQITPVRFPLDTPMYYTLFTINQYRRQSWRSIGQLNVESSVVLPIPAQIIDTQQVSYDTRPIGITGAGVMSALGNIQNAIQGALQGLGAGLAAQSATIAKAVENQLAGVLGTGITDGVLASQGLAVNDFLTVLLKGPAYKQLRFSWKLSPRTLQESQSIKQIEILLKNAQAPSWGDAVGAFWSWPRVFNIGFRSAVIGDMGDRLFRFKPSVMTASAFNYAPGGVPGFFGGGRDSSGNWQPSNFPEAVEIQLMFTELEFWINDKGVQNAYNPSVIGPSPAREPVANNSTDPISLGVTPF